MKDRNRELFQALTLPYLDRLLAAARCRIDSVELAEDLVQEAYLNAWRCFADLSDLQLIYPWMFCILRRLIADHYRQHARRQLLISITNLDESYEAMLTSGEDEPYERLVDAAARQRLADLLERLPENFAEALVLHDLEGFKYREIAEITGTELGTVMSRIHRARRMLLALARDQSIGNESIQATAARKLKP